MPTNNQGEKIDMHPLNQSHYVEEFERKHDRELRVVFGGKSPVWYQYQDPRDQKTEEEKLRGGLWVEVPVQRVCRLMSKMLRGELEALKKHQNNKGEYVGKDSSEVTYMPKKEAFLRGCFSAGSIRSMVASVGGLGLVVCKLEDFDKDPYMLAVKNGVLDLSGDQPVLREFLPEYMLTKKTRARYNGRAPKPGRFLSFLDEVTKDAENADDVELKDWLRRLYGYTLSGAANEDVIPIYIGGGINGKSKLMEAVAHALGDYSGATEIQELAGATRNQSQNNEALVGLKGCRFAWCDEMPMHAAWDPAKFKKLTGGTLRGMQKFKPPVEFQSTCVVHLGGQHLPAAMDLSDGFWRRVRVVPFRQNFEDRRDILLLDQLKADADYVLWWMVQGWAEWKADGLSSCKAVEEATAAYKDKEVEATPVGFVNDGFDVDKARLDIEYRVSWTEFIKLYEEWCRANGTKPWTGKRVDSILAEQGFTIKKSRCARESSAHREFVADSSRFPVRKAIHGLRIKYECFEQFGGG